MAEASKKQFQYKERYTDKKFAATAPTHILGAKVRNSGANTVAGCGWFDANTGRMRIKLNPCVVLSWDDDVMLNLFPATETSDHHKQQSQHVAGDAGDAGDPGNADTPEEKIPF